MQIVIPIILAVVGLTFVIPSDVAKAVLFFATAAICYFILRPKTTVIDDGYDHPLDTSDVENN